MTEILSTFSHFMMMTLPSLLQQRLSRGRENILSEAKSIHHDQYEVGELSFSDIEVREASKSDAYPQLAAAMLKRTYRSSYEQHAGTIFIVFGLQPNGEVKVVHSTSV